MRLLIILILIITASTSERAEAARRKTDRERFEEKQRLRKLERDKALGIDRRRKLVKFEPPAGSASVEARAFENDGKDRTIDQSLTLGATLDLQFSTRKIESRAWNFARFDLLNKDRYLVLPYENYFGLKSSSYSARVGFQIENWSMLEVFNPSDVFNSRNLDSEIHDQEKIGEVALAVKFQLSNGTVALYYMPFFFSPNYPVETARLSPLPSEYIGGAPKFLKNGAFADHFGSATQYALRITQKWGDADVAAHYIEHIDRNQPVAVFDPLASQPFFVFMPVRQIGFNGVLPAGDFLVKWDLVNRNFPATLVSERYGKVEQQSHSVAAAGLEYSIGHESGSESVLLLEYQRMLVDDMAARRKLGTFANDVVTGYRYNFGDTDDSTVEGLGIWDLDHSGEVLAAVTAKRRFGSNIKVSAGYRMIIAPANPGESKEGSLQAYDDADFGFVNLAYYF